MIEGIILSSTCLQLDIVENMSQDLTVASILALASGGRMFNIPLTDHVVFVDEL